MQRRPQAEIAERVREMLALVNLSGYEQRRVVELSGGEQQRVALARSLAPRPRLLMLDEPLGALDRSLREQLMNDLRAILKGVGVTVLYVTHDQEEAFAVADRVLIMRAQVEAGLGGWVEQEGTPQAVYRHPATAYVAGFLGFQNLLEGKVAGEGEVDTALGRLASGDTARTFAPGTRVTVLIRPEAADVRPAGDGGLNVVSGRLVSWSFRGSYYLIRTAHVGGIELTCEASAADADLPAVGEPLSLWLDPAAIALLPGS
jgi:ABC-type Fe3+/spermidine/putrescine transport system ATPase subunit